MVLQPSKRLTALQVLDSLDSIIATFRTSIVIGEEDQVVPEITKCKENKKEESNSKNSLSDFSRHITLQVNES